MSENSFKCIYLVCVDHSNDINHVIGRNPSLKKARRIASDARSKWPEREIYISVEKILKSPFVQNSTPTQMYTKPVEEATTAAKNPVESDEVCICGARKGYCVGNLNCRCNALAKCKNIDLTKDNPFDTNPGWGLPIEHRVYEPTEDPEEYEEYEEEEYEDNPEEEYYEEDEEYEDEEEYEDDEEYEDEEEYEV